MALSSTLVWEIRRTGSSANGGAFRAGAAGTDYSQQDAPQVTYTDLTVDATSNTKVTSAANPFGPAHVGNLINITGGTGWTNGRYEVISVTGNVATLDRSPAAVNATGGQGRLGGAADSLNTIAPAIVASNVVWIRYDGGTPYLVGSSVLVATGPTFAANAPYTRISGYAVTRGDKGLNGIVDQRPTIRANSTGVIVVQVTSSIIVEHLIIDGNNTTATSGLVATTRCELINCKIVNTTTAGIQANSSTTILGCEIANFSGTAGIQHGATGNLQVVGCWIHDASTVGINAGGATNVFVARCVISNLSGAASDGIQVASGCVALNNTICNVGRHGINQPSPQTAGTFIAQGNILAMCGGYGMAGLSAAGMRADPLFDGNAYWNNGVGNRTNLDDAGAVNVQNASGPYMNIYDVVLSADPFVARGANDFRLNATAGAGGACRGAAVPKAWPGLSIAGYPDFGAVQHQEATSGSSIGGGRVIGSGVILPTRRSH